MTLSKNDVIFNQILVWPVTLLAMMSSRKNKNLEIGISNNVTNAVAA